LFSKKYQAVFHRQKELRFSAESAVICQLAKSMAQKAWNESNRSVTDFPTKQFLKWGFPAQAFLLQRPGCAITRLPPLGAY